MQTLYEIQPDGKLREVELKQPPTMTLFILAIAFAAALIFFVNYAASIPIVQFSHSSQSCVDVVGDEFNGCENMPEKYIVEWVE